MRMRRQDKVHIARSYIRRRAGRDARHNADSCLPCNDAMTLKTSDLCDACEGALPCALPLRGWGRRRAFAGNIRTIRCHEDIALMRELVGQQGNGQVLVIDGGGSVARAIFGDVMAAVAARNGWAW
jgi:regulator of RNase E activity RraA